MKKWKSGKKEIISLSIPLLAPGKSNFFLKTLAPYCKENNFKIVVFSNRDTLKKQNESIGSDFVMYCNYQYVEHMRTRERLSFLRSFDFLVFDECHYFFKDSNFNENTDKIFKYALNRSDQIKIFASATPEPLFYSKLKFNHKYTLPANYNYIEKIVFYNDVSEIIDIITKSESKTLFFFSDVIKALNFKNEYKETTKFVCSRSNPFYPFSDKDTVKEIVSTSTFNGKILATTSTLDNGINIIDKDVKNVVIDFYDPISIIQILR